jgi:hypothetical protein
MADIKFSDEKEKNDIEDKNKDVGGFDKSRDLENIAMEELKNIDESECETEFPPDEEFGDIDINIEDNEIEDALSMGEDKAPKSANECMLSALLDYFFFFYFMTLALMYKELRNKGKFVKEFIEKNKTVMDEIKVRFERFLANNMPNTYEKLIKVDDYAFIFGIAMLTINFHIEIQENIASSQEIQSDKSPKKEPSKNEETIQNIHIEPVEVAYDEQW